MRVRGAASLVIALAVAAATLASPPGAHAFSRSVMVDQITMTSARAGVTLTLYSGESSPVSATVYLRYEVRDSNSYTSLGSCTVTDTSYCYKNMTGLTAGTSYRVSVSYNSAFSGYSSRYFTTITPASITSLAISGITTSTATAAVGLTNPDSLSATIYLRYKKSADTAWTASNATTTGTSHTFLFGGLDHATEYQVEASLSNSYADPTSATFTTDAIADACDETNNPPVDLGEIGIDAGSALSHQGSVPGTVAAAPCVDADSRSGVYFRFSVASGEAGAVKIEARPGTSTMTPDLLVRSGDAYTGDALFKDTRAGEDNALAAGLVAAGTYTLQLRAEARLADNDPSSGGLYSVTVTRLQPRVASVSSLPTSLTTIWDVGAATSTGTDNEVDLSVMIDYRADSAQAWTAAETSISPSDQQQSVSTTITGLDAGNIYHFRAAFTNATVYAESGGLLTEARILLSGAPYGLEATAQLVDAAIRRYEVRAAWETPPIEADDNIEWGYGTKVDGGVTRRNESGREHVQETVFFYSGDAVRGGVLTIEVNNSFECLGPDASETDPWTTCSLTYDERDYILPVDAYWSTPWSAPALARIADSGFTAGTTGMDKPPDDAVVQLIDLGFELAGVAPEDRPSHALSVMLCAAIALTAGIGIALKTGGMKLPQVALGSGLFYSIFGGLGPFLFGVPGALVVVTVAAPVGLGGAWLMRRFAL